MSRSRKSLPAYRVWHSRQRTGTIPAAIRTSSHRVLGFDARKFVDRHSGQAGFIACSWVSGGDTWRWGSLMANKGRSRVLTPYHHCFRAGNVGVDIFRKSRLEGQPHLIPSTQLQAFN